MVEQITPLLLTYNEEPNIARTMKRLHWAQDIVVVDSFSMDRTREIAASFPNARVFQRRFDNHACQWNFGLRETRILTEWVLAMDADYLLTERFIEEIRGFDPASPVVGYRARFVYCLGEKALRASLYPPAVVLFRREKGCYEQDGHTQRLRLDGEVNDLMSPVLHDDRKPFERWLENQRRYADLEAEKLLSTPFSALNLQDGLRRLLVLTPPAVFGYCLFVKGLCLEGIPGWAYATQRFLAETLLSVALMRRTVAGLPKIGSGRHSGAGRASSGIGPGDSQGSP